MPIAADEAGRVLVDDVEHVAVEVGLDLDAEQLDQARLGVAEQRAGDRALARARSRRVTRSSVW